MERYNIIPGGEFLDKAVGYGALALKGLIRVGAMIAMRYDRPFASHGDHFINPLDTPVQPISSFPNERRASIIYPYDSEGTPVE